MKTYVIVVGIVALVGVLLIGGLAVGAAVWTFARAADGPDYRWDSGTTGGGMMDYDRDPYERGNGMMGGGMMGPGAGPYNQGNGMMGPGMMGPGSDYNQGNGMMGPGAGPYNQGNGMMGPGMMGPGSGYNQGNGMMGPGMMGGWRAPEDVESLDDAAATFEAYVDNLGFSWLKITEVMEFEYNYYAIAAETDTGSGAMELILDKDSGWVRLEQGPNMMWNAKYGMMGRNGGMMGMMGGYATGEMTLSPEQAQEAAQRWLDDNLPGAQAGEADPFYGYYTFHFLQDGRIAGMLSVHGSSGDVWFHSWHGDFVAMTEEHD